MKNNFVFLFWTCIFVFSCVREFWPLLSHCSILTIPDSSSSSSSLASFSLPISLYIYIFFFYFIFFLCFLFAVARALTLDFSVSRGGIHVVYLRSCEPVRVPSEKRGRHRSGTVYIRVVKEEPETNFISVYLYTFIKVTLYKIQKDAVNANKKLYSADWSLNICSKHTHTHTNVYKVKKKIK